jgi:hypothetical protein
MITRVGKEDCGRLANAALTAAAEYAGNSIRRVGLSKEKTVSGRFGRLSHEDRGEQFAGFGIGL